MISGDNNAQVHISSLCYRFSMRILFVDIASHDGLIALCTEEAVIALKSIDHRIGDHELIVFFESVLKKAKWKSGELTHIACVIGPGGFTSLRTGVAFANALAWSLKIPIVGVHLSDLYAVRATQPSFLWLHSTKKNELFVRGFGTYGQKWPEPIHVLLDEISENIYWCGELLSEHIRSSWKDMPLRSVKRILPQFLQEQTYTDKSVVPWYGREG